MRGIKDNALATKLARTAVARLQKTHASVVSKVKELQVDASSGVVRDENGNEIARYEDLIVEGAKVSRPSSQTSSPKRSGSRGHRTNKSVSSIGSGSGSGSGIGTGAATGAGLGASGIAAAAARDASAKHPHLTEPTHHTLANTGKYDYASAGQNQISSKQYESTPGKVQPPYPEGVSATRNTTADPRSTTGGNHGLGYDENKIHSSGHPLKESSGSSGFGSGTGYSGGLPAHSNYDDVQYSSSHGHAAGSAGLPGRGLHSNQEIPRSSENTSQASRGLPTHSNYDEKETETRNAYTDSENNKSQLGGGLSGLAASIVGASGIGGALESMGVTSSGNTSSSNRGASIQGDKAEAGVKTTDSTQHLLGSNAYPKDAVREYSTSSSSSTLDNRINDATGGQYKDHSRGSVDSRNIPSSFSRGEGGHTSLDPVNYGTAANTSDNTKSQQQQYTSNSSSGNASNYATTNPAATTGGGKSNDVLKDLEVGSGNTATSHNQSHVPRKFDSDNYENVTAAEYINDGGLDDSKYKDRNAFAQPTTNTAASAVGNAGHNTTSSGLGASHGVPTTSSSTQPAATSVGGGVDAYDEANTSTGSYRMPGGWD